MTAQLPDNPAITFLRTPCGALPDQVILDYARFLLREAGITKLPVQLDRIRKRFNFPVMHRQLAPDQRGFTTADLRIYLNTSDLPAVRKFTLAHEFVEVLYFALKEGHADHWMSDALFTTLCENKERYCDVGAAEIVMPMGLFRPLVAQAPMSLPRAQEIAATCAVSLMATLWRIIEAALAPVVLIIWRHKHKPSEHVPSRIGQGNLFGPPEAMDPPKKMRVERVIALPGTPFIPLDKSAPLESSIQRAFLTNTAASDYEQLDLVGIRGRFLVESRPFTAEGERRVLSLIHLADQC